MGNSNSHTEAEAPSTLPVNKLKNNPAWSGALQPTLLSPAHLTYFYSYILPEHLKNWRVLYQSWIHGQSMSMFSKAVFWRGASLIILKVRPKRDEDSVSNGNSDATAIIGCYCTDSWKLSSSFYGTQHSFLFEVKWHSNAQSTSQSTIRSIIQLTSQSIPQSTSQPSSQSSSQSIPQSSSQSIPQSSSQSSSKLIDEVLVYEATGSNSNYQYYCYGKASLPTGLGVGGQRGYFGIFLDDSFASGHSRKTNTYNNPVLGCDGGKGEFRVLDIEVIGLMDPSELTEDESWELGKFTGTNKKRDEDGIFGKVDASTKFLLDVGGVTKNYAECAGISIEEERKVT